MKKKSIKNLALNKNSVSKLQSVESIGGGTFRCILSIIDQNGNNICLQTRVPALCPTETQTPGCAFTVEVDAFTIPIC
jgi:hypothetical protein